MKHYTTIEQSKKLLELGLNPETADMYWFRDDTEIPKIFPKDMMKDSVSVTLPCWSLGALLELMPTFLILEDIPCLLSVKKYNQRYEIYYANNGFAPKGIIESNTSIKASYSMVVWLLENNYIKKGDKKCI